MNLHAITNLTFMGADASQWASALMLACVTYIGLTLGMRFLLARLRSIAKASTNTVDDDIVEVLSSSNHGLLAVMSLLIGIGLLSLAEPWHKRVDQLWFIALALQAGLWGARAVTRFLARYVARHAGDNPLHTSATATLMSWGLRTFLWAVVGLAILSNLGVNITAFVASLGVGGIAVALAVQNILGDLFASLSIAIDKPFEVGDFVVVDGVAGTIEMVGLKSTRIRSLGGEQVVMSNTDLLKQKISNYKRLKERRIVYTFGVTYDTTAEQAEEVPRIVRRVVESSERLRFDRAHLLNFGESSLDYEVVFFVLDPDYNIYMDERQALNLKLMRELAGIGVQFAFPTRTLHVASLPPDLAFRGGMAVAEDRGAPPTQPVRSGVSSGNPSAPG